MMSLHPKYFVLMFISFWIFNLSHLNFFNKTSSTHSDVKKKPVHVLVVSSWRSGSSFLGQIFNHHRDVFYLFEPGSTIWKRFKNESSELLHFFLRDLLRSLFTCDMSPLPHYMSKSRKYVFGMNFYGESRALCSPPACTAFTRMKSYDRLKCYYECQGVPLEIMAETCRTYSHVVMKTVRILDLSVLLPLFRDPDLDLRILHLVRDPRGIASSRLHINLTHDDKIVLKGSGDPNITLSRVMEKVCKAQVDINNVAKAAKELEGRYMVIRHEDLSLEPVKSIKNIFTFAGLCFTKDMEQWAYNVTHQEVIKKRYGPMIFSRVSSKVVQKWRTQLSYNFVRDIQETCKEAMDRFGYRAAKSETEQRNLMVGLMEDERSLERRLL